MSKGKRLVNVDGRIIFDPEDFGAGPGSGGRGPTRDAEGKAQHLRWTEGSEAGDS